MISLANYYSPVATHTPLITSYSINYDMRFRKTEKKERNAAVAIAMFASGGSYAAKSARQCIPLVCHIASK